METLLGYDRRDKLRLYTQLANFLPGNIAEVGVYKGGSAEIIAEKKLPKKKLFLFDTFCGMPETSPEDNYHKKGNFSDTSYEAVLSGMKKFENVHVFKGVFPEENSDVVASESFCMVHIDVDIYKSYMDCLNFFWPRLVKNGIMIFDDYHEKSCLGAKKAVDEFFVDKIEKPIWPCWSQACLIKS